MSRHIPLVGIAMITAILTALAGCAPQQPFYLKHVDCELAHYKGVATEIEYPDVDADRLDDVSGAQRPYSLANQDKREVWDLTLEEAMEIALRNNKIMRTLGGQVQGPPDFLLRNPELIPTIYDTAMAETDPNTSVEAALSRFDAQLNSSLTWEKRDTPQNINANTYGLLFEPVDREDLGTFQAQLRKTTATGGTFSLTHNVAYDKTNNPTVAYPSDWNVNLVAEMRQPLLQGAGVQFNRIAGPDNNFASRPGFATYNGVMVARIRTDIRLADFEMGVRNLVNDVETAYWELYFAYRALDTATGARNATLDFWRRVKILNEQGSEGGEAFELARVREQYYAYRAAVESALGGNGGVYQVEAKLRYLLGLAATDGRLIRPKDEPTTAKVVFDWNEVLCEGLARNVELREQKWIVKRCELELIASKNFLLPRLDFVAQYRWLGLGNRLDGANPLSISDLENPPPFPNTNAYRTMTSGEFQEWQMGFQFNMPLGFRREMAGVRNAQLGLARERTKLQEGELELSHQLAYAIRDVESNHVMIQTNFNHRIAAEQELKSASTAYEVGAAQIRGVDIFERLLNARQKLAETEGSYYRSIVEYNRSIAQVHFRKGSLLEYNGVCLAEGPWPAKAYFDARRRARERAASTYLDYGFTQPRVISRGPINQQADGGALFQGGEPAASPAPGPAPQQAPSAGQPELMPTPDPQPAGGPQASVSGGGKQDAGWNSLARMSPAAKAADKRDVAGPVLALSPPTRPDNQHPSDGQRVAEWAVANGGANHESGANSATAAVDRPAPGWTGVQH
jgi:hypothetical protein